VRSSILLALAVTLSFAPTLLRGDPQQQLEAEFNYYQHLYVFYCAQYEANPTPANLSGRNLAAVKLDSIVASLTDLTFGLPLPPPVTNGTSGTLALTEPNGARSVPDTGSAGMLLGAALLTVFCTAAMRPPGPPLHP
jgi:hypothetical protein